MKLVREHINEKFTEKSDPVKDMSVGINGAIEYIRKKIKFVNTSITPGDYAVFLYCLYKEEDLDLAFFVIEHFIKHREQFIYDHVEQIFRSFKRDDHIWQMNANANRKNNKEFKNRIMALIMDEAKKDKQILEKLMIIYFNLKDYENVKKMIEMGGDPTFERNKLIKKAIDKGNKELFDILAKYVKWK